MKLCISYFICVLLLVASCSKDKINYSPQRPAGCDTTTLIVSYHNDIQRILSTNCSGTTCHNAGTGNYDFSTYKVVADRIRNGKMDYRLLLPVNDPTHMPQTGPPLYQGTNLDPCDLYKILTWIKQGYQNN